MSNDPEWEFFPLVKGESRSNLENYGFIESEADFDLFTERALQNNYPEPGRHAAPPTNPAGLTLDHYAPFKATIGGEPVTWSGAPVQLTGASWYTGTESHCGIDTEPTFDDLLKSAPKPRRGRLRPTWLLMVAAAGAGYVTGALAVWFG